MEPMNATARYTPDKCEVWSSSQNGEAALAAASEASGLPAEKCDFYNTILGGGFGRRARSEYVSHAVRIAKEMPGTPIKLIKSREDDMANGVYHPITQCKLIGALDANNEPDRAARAHFRPVDPRRREPARRCRTGAIRSRSRACIRAARKARSATPSRTC